MCRGHFLPETDTANLDGGQLVVCLTQVTQVKPRTLAVLPELPALNRDKYGRVRMANPGSSTVR